MYCLQHISSIKLANRQNLFHRLKHKGFIYLLGFHHEYLAARCKVQTLVVVHEDLGHRHILPSKYVLALAVHSFGLDRQPSTGSSNLSGPKTLLEFHASRIIALLSSHPQLLLCFLLVLILLFSSFLWFYGVVATGLFTVVYPYL